jgi:hypothetical protein
VAHKGSSVEQHAARAARKAGPWVERLARTGYVAYGVVYVLVGVLAVQAALGGGGQATGQEGALRSILLAPLGRVLLGLIVIGLLAYATWRLFQGIRDPENEGTDAKGIVKRFDHVINGLFHAALAFSAGQLVLGSGGGGGSPDDLTARLMAQPLGRWLVVIVGVVFVGAGLYQFYKVYRADFRDELKLGEMGTREKAWATRSGRFRVRRPGRGLRRDRSLPGPGGPPDRPGRGPRPGRRAADPGPPALRPVHPGCHLARARRLRRLHVRHGPLPTGRALTF